MGLFLPHRSPANVIAVKASATERAPIEQASLALAATLLPLTTAATLPAFADEAAPAATDAAAAAASGFLGFTPLGWAIAFSPVAIYGGFYLYRQYLNPKAKIGDLLFFIAASVILGNIASVLIFKRRLY